MEIAELENPFDYANAVRTPARFAARSNELMDMAYILEQTKPNNPLRFVAIHGERGLGKTSFVNMIVELSRNRGYITAKIDLASGDDDELSFFSKVYEELASALLAQVPLQLADGSQVNVRTVRRAMAGLQPADFPLEFPESIHQARTGGFLSELALRADMSFLGRLCEVPIVIAIDEAQVIARNDRVLSILRNIGGQINGYLVVLAGTTNLIERVNVVYGHLLRQFDLIELTRFQEIAEVEQCISKALDSIGLNAQTEVPSLIELASDILVITDGNPHHVQMICNAMFAKWQKGEAPTIELTPPVLDDVRRLLDVGRGMQDRPLVDALVQMDEKALIAFNVLSGANDQAGLDDYWFAYVLGGTPGGLTRSDLSKYLQLFIGEGILEIENSKIRVVGDYYDQTYARIWTKQAIGMSAVLSLTSSNPYRHLLAHQLQHLLIVNDVPNSGILETCCLGMDPSHLENAIHVIKNHLTSTADYPFCTTYLHNAIAQVGNFEGIRLLQVDCSYGEHRATRWLYHAPDEEIDLWQFETFVHTAAAVDKLGGNLSVKNFADLTASWPQMLEFISVSAPSVALANMADLHLHQSYAAYEVDDVGKACDHLRTALKLCPSWHVANNLLYIALSKGIDVAVAGLEGIALDLAQYADARALTLYNVGLIRMRQQDWSGAITNLNRCMRELESVLMSDQIAEYLVLVSRVNGTLAYHEDAKADLASACKHALKIADLKEREEELAR